MAQAPDRCAYRPIVGDSVQANRLSAEQAAHEANMTDVEETLLNIEQAIHRADRAYRAVMTRAGSANLELALKDSLDQLEAARKALFQATYFAGDQQRLI